MIPVLELTPNPPCRNRTSLMWLHGIDGVSRTLWPILSYLESHHDSSCLALPPWLTVALADANRPGNQ